MFLPLLSARPEAHAFKARSITVQNGHFTLKPGALDAEVRRYVGSPDLELNDHVRAYHGFGPNGVFDSHSCDIMLLTFANDQVVDIKLINSEALTVLKRRLQKGEGNLTTAFVAPSDGGFDQTCAPDGTPLPSGTK
ncbi:MAG TPA: hypothetical protein VK178_01400 [Opitutaceae bacterium]|nr:hypothetical protein [Opitutaceae bacterium]